MKTKTIKIDWLDLKSIERGEVKKAKLENAGWLYVKTINGLNTSATIYKRN